MVHIIKGGRQMNILLQTNLEKGGGREMQNYFLLVNNYLKLASDVFITFLI